MRFKEFLKENSLPSYEDVKAWIARATANSMTRPSPFTITPEGLNFSDHLSIVPNPLERQMLEDCGLPFKINKVAGDFFISNIKITSTKNFPNEVGGEINFANTLISSLEGIPLKIGGALNFGNTQIRNLEKFTDVFKQLSVDCIRCDWENIQSGGIGLLLIKNLNTLESRYGFTVIDDPETPFNIISRYLGRPDDIFECQAELIDAGLEKYAQL